MMPLWINPNRCIACGLWPIPPDCRRLLSRLPSLDPLPLPAELTLDEALALAAHVRSPQAFADVCAPCRDKHGALITAWLETIGEEVR